MADKKKIKGLKELEIGAEKSLDFIVICYNHNISILNLYNLIKTYN